MTPAMFTWKFTLGAEKWRWALEHDPGVVKPKAGGKRGEMLRWTGAATHLYFGPVTVCMVWKESA